VKLELLVIYRAELASPVEVGKGPFGARTIFDVTGGVAEGPRLRGRLLPSGADWLLVDDGGTGRLDVRGTLYFMTQPRFETGDPRYGWLNRVVAVAEGRLLPNAVEYRVYELLND
jgi:hypothetical protein